MTPLLFSLLIIVLSTGCVPIRSDIPSASWTTQIYAQAENSNPMESPVSTPSIRVAIAVHQLSVHLMIPSGFELEGLSPMDATNLDENHQSFLSFDLTVHDLPDNTAWISPKGEGEVEVNGIRYPGRIELMAQKNGCLTVVNELSLENYVMGVLAGEIPGNWPMEALRAQAIAARTFALYQQNQAKKKKQFYDLENNAEFQMYMGSRLVNQNIREAVLSTQGEILTFEDQPIMAVFHSNCGGETTSAQEVWGGSGKPYLRPVSCPFGNEGAHYRWSEKLSVSYVVQKLREADIPISDIVQVDSIVRDESQRIIRLVLVEGDGSRQEIRGTTFRMALGPDMIRSTRFDVEVKGNQMVFTGRGWGHGVGLCQEGACGMAKAGYSAFDILRHYYYGVILDQIKNE